MRLDCPIRRDRGPLKWQVMRIIASLLMRIFCIFDSKLNTCFIDCFTSRMKSKSIACYYLKENVYIYRESFGPWS